MRAIKTIDQIARQKQRDVLFIQVKPNPLKSFEHYQNYKPWQEIKAWLVDNSIPHEICGAFSKDSLILAGYCGDIYIDLPNDDSLEMIQKIDEYFNYTGERLDGKQRLCIFSYDEAIKYAERDTAEFWDDI
ncbi:hypothetical protein [Francisella philomiragia]|uniref:Uncharacterized protein n=1 Tax=Francisella philomiragia TaxID=28110 RepID=A0ABS1G958_9GAMM|nr:hypothetical protein [Francisella philomiragia]MBK2257662.1 hypothetical protein [Francisella philomiragia]MBK2301350.1 hypothetical protein [Francisella philomiragia]